MQITLENETGKARGRLVLKTGQFMRVGRKLPADLTGNEDAFMSSLHFLIECRADCCRISDMESRNGTFLNGARITDAFLREGDVIVAGRTRFRVHIQVEEGVEAPRVGSPDFTGVLGEGTLDLHHEPKDLREILSPQSGEHLYALLDAARDDRVLELLRESKDRYQSLYEGQQGEDLANFAPYLVELPKDSPLLNTLIKEGWGKSWGIYLISSKSFEEVRKHFRHFLLVQTEDGKELYFRFYDPRVLRVFLPTCNPNEVAQFFGPTRRYLVEDDEEPDGLRQFDECRRSREARITRASYKLRQEQLDALSVPFLQRADVQLAEYAKNRFPSIFKSSSAETLRALAAKVRACARQYGIEREDSIATFLDFAVMYGEDFDKSHWASDILSSGALHGPDKVAILRHRARRSGAKL